ncbi:MAG: hypothetical protein EPN93_17275 [Spirochaetes bacterium]|nr:MAG: hypothetical protein EPN93_17275 [Spirochaetota bacterium]
MNRALSLVLLCLAVAVISSPVSGGENRSEYDPAELVDLALKRSELLTASEKDVESEKWMKEQAGTWQNPALGFSAGNKSSSGKNGIGYDMISPPTIKNQNTHIICNWN